MQHSTVIDKGTHSTTYMNRQQVHRQVLSSDVASRHEKGDNHHGEWEWAGDRSG